MAGGRSGVGAAGVVVVGGHAGDAGRVQGALAVQVGEHVDEALLGQRVADGHLDRADAQQDGEQLGAPQVVVELPPAVAVLRLDVDAQAARRGREGSPVGVDEVLSAGVGALVDRVQCGSGWVGKGQVGQRVAPSCQGRGRALARGVGWGGC